MRHSTSTSTINKDILRLAIPSILANITIPLVGIVDTAIVGHISDASAIGGIAIGTMLFDLLYWNFGFLRLGTSGLTAQAYGGGRECGDILSQSLLVSAAGALLVWLIQWLFVTAVLWVVPCSDEVAGVARTYFFIRIWAAPATLSLMAFKGWFIGMQDTRSPMAVDIVVNVINMAASYVLAVTAGLGVAGVAWGTLIAQYTGLVLASGIVFFRYHIVPLSFRDEVAIWRKTDWRRYFSLNGNLFIRSLCIMVVYVGFTSLASRYGDTQLAVSSVIMKLFLFFSYFVDGFAYAGEALVGKVIGMYDEQMYDERRRKVKEVVRALFAWSLGVGVFFTVVYAVWGMDSLGLLTSDTEVLRAAQPYWGWLVAMPIISTLAFMWDGIYVGATAGVPIRNAMIWAAVAFVGVYMIASHLALPDSQDATLNPLFAAYFAHLLARVIYLSLGWHKL